MLLNFCEPRLKSMIKCSVISTDGYEATNLLSNPCNGFLAYCAIKPPVDLDITFVCNVQISYIKIWSCVGSQKSSGFQLYSKTAPSEPYMLISSQYLTPAHTGLLLHSAGVNLEHIHVPENFLKCCIRSSPRPLTAFSHSIRLTICKTENSIPALGRIEIWGLVSLRCKRSVITNVHRLLSNHDQPTASSSLLECKTNATDSPIDTEKNQEIKSQIPSGLEIPENFLDSITCEIMTQPIMLPSGNVIDQTTLEKHGQNEAIWGRPLSDPFTGMIFTEQRRPILASALKSMIDKFLLMNSNNNEIKKIPRVLGHDSAIAGDRRIIQIPKCVLNENSSMKTAENPKPNKHGQTTDDISKLLHQPKKFCHQLPMIVPGPQRYIAKIKTKKLKQVKQISDSPDLICNNSYIDNTKKNELDVSAAKVNSLDSEQFLLPNIRRFTASEKVERQDASSNCSCCNYSILYKLPCKHVICRKVLLSITNSQCTICGFFYKSSEIKRIHPNI